MESYRVVWSGEIEKRIHDLQVRPAPPLEDHRKFFSSQRRKRAMRRVGLTDAAMLRLFLGLGRSSRTRRKVH
jgi:hypothetical protein